MTHLLTIYTETADDLFKVRKLLPKDARAKIKGARNSIRVTEKGLHALKLKFSKKQLPVFQATAQTIVLALTQQGLKAKLGIDNFHSNDEREFNLKIVVTNPVSPA